MPVTINGTSGITTPGLTLGTSAFSPPSGSAPSYTCRAWVNFNGGGVIAIRGSGNVTSITDNNVANYTVNFTTAMPDTGYAVVACANATSGSTTASNSRSLSAVSYSVGSVQCIVQIGTGNVADQDLCNVTVFR